MTHVLYLFVSDIRLKSALIWLARPENDYSTLCKKQMAKSLNITIHQPALIMVLKVSVLGKRLLKVIKYSVLCFNLKNVNFLCI